MKNLIFMFMVLSMAFSYNWPCTPFSQQHPINGTFCECRSGSDGDRDHFHDGVDIDLAQGHPVYSVINGTVTSFSTSAQSGINAYIRVGRYAYVHVDPNPTLSVGSNVVAFETVVGWTNSWNHIHFKDGYPGSEINAIRLNGGLDPLEDPYDPTVHDIKFYVDGTETEFVNGQIYGEVDIVSKATDMTDTSPIGDNNGIYKIGLDVIDSAGTVVFGPRTPFEFDEIPNSDNYITNVYAEGSNTSTYRYTVTNNIHSNNKLDVSDWSTGVYTARVFTWDQYFNADTLTRVFEVVEPDMYSPEPPTFTSVVPSGNGFELHWLPNSEDDLLGYRLYFSYDYITWNNNHNESILTAETTSYTVPQFGSSLVYFYLTAVDDSPFMNESAPSNTMVYRKSPIGNPILFVNGLDHAGLSSNSMVEVGNIISDYSTIGIMTVHDTVISLHSDSLLNQENVMVHMGSRKRGIAQDFSSWLLSRYSLVETKTITLGLGSAAVINSTQSGQTYLDTLGIDSVSWLVPSEDMSISTNGILHALGIIEVSTDFDSISVGYDTQLPSAIPVLSNDGLFGFGRGSSYVITLPFASFPDPDAPVLNLLNYLSPGSVTIDAKDNILPESFSTIAYPNPFNNQFTVQISGPPGQYEVFLNDLLGSNVLFESLEKTVESPIIISVRADQLSLASGVYFLRIHQRNNSIQQTQKIMYLK